MGRVAGRAALAVLFRDDQNTIVDLAKDNVELLLAQDVVELDKNVVGGADEGGSVEL